LKDLDYNSTSKNTNITVSLEPEKAIQVNIPRQPDEGYDRVWQRVYTIDLSRTNKDFMVFKSNHGKYDIVISVKRTTDVDGTDLDLKLAENNEVLGITFLEKEMSSTGDVVGYRHDFHDTFYELHKEFELDTYQYDTIPIVFQDVTTKQLERELSQQLERLEIISPNDLTPELAAKRKLAMRRCIVTLEYIQNQCNHGEVFLRRDNNNKLQQIVVRTYSEVSKETRDKKIRSILNGDFLGTLDKIKLNPNNRKGDDLMLFPTQRQKHRTLHELDNPQPIENTDSYSVFDYLQSTQPIAEDNTSSLRSAKLRNPDPHYIQAFLEARFKNLKLFNNKEVGYKLFTDQPDYTRLSNISDVVYRHKTFVIDGNEKELSKWWKNLIDSSGRFAVSYYDKSSIDNLEQSEFESLKELYDLAQHFTPEEIFPDGKRVEDIPLNHRIRKFQEIKECYPEIYHRLVEYLYSSSIDADFTLNGKTSITVSDNLTSSFKLRSNLDKDGTDKGVEITFYVNHEEPNDELIANTFNNAQTDPLDSIWHTKEASQLRYPDIPKKFRRFIDNTEELGGSVTISMFEIFFQFGCQKLRDDLLFKNGFNKPESREKLIKEWLHRINSMSNDEIACYGYKLFMTSHPNIPGSFSGLRKMCKEGDVNMYDLVTFIKEPVPIIVK
jgi:hypothetical protein